MFRSLTAVAFTLAAAVALPPAALGQTVADYREAIRTAPIVEAPTETAAAYCRPLENFVYVSIPTWELKQPWLLGVLPFDGSPDATVARKREACLQFRALPVIQFDDRSGQQIVTPPSVDDPASIYAPGSLPPRL